MQKFKRKSSELDNSTLKNKAVKNENIHKKGKGNKSNSEKTKGSIRNKDVKRFQRKTKEGTLKSKSILKAFKNIKASNNEKPKWSEMKKEKKQLRIARRKAKTSSEVFEISHKAKLLSAQIQRKVVKNEFRLKASKELHGLLKGQYKTIALTHDLSRVIQVLLKYSPDDIKSDISEEVLDIIVQMAQSKYGHHAVKRMLKYGTDFIRHEIIKKFLGHTVSLASHSISAPILDYAYTEFASKKEKAYMQQEFYGDIYKNTKDDKVQTLRDSYKDSPEMKSAILQSCKANIQRILDKNLHDSELMHAVLYDYMTECTLDDRVELISTLSTLIVPLSNSLPGVNVASMCVWQGTNKDKKAILKVVKEHVVSLSKHKTGYRLLLTIFDSVDDTVLVKKTIVTTLANNLKELSKDHWGNMILHWLVKPKDSVTFHPSLVKFLEEGMKTGTSKKDNEIRVLELREGILPAMKKDIESDPEFWLGDKMTLLLAVAVLSIDCTNEILEALVQAICRPDWKVMKNMKEFLAIEDAGIHMCLKKLASLDKNKVEGTFGEYICNYLDDITMKCWIATNRGCFFLLKIIENNQEDVTIKLIKKIKVHSEILKKNLSEGGKLLLQKIQGK